MRKFIMILLILILAGLALWYFFFKKEKQVVRLITEKPRYGYISKSVTATGAIRPVDTVAVGSQVSGTIKAVYTDFNARVKKGQLIAELDKSLFQAQVDQYKSNLDVAKSALLYQKSNFDRQTFLYNSGAISKADFENAQNQYASAKATVGSVQAQLDAATKNLSYASILSPVDGVVMTRNISVGQTVAASFNTPTLFVIAKDITKMQAEAAVSEADIGDVKNGLRVSFTVDAYPDLTFNGAVNQVRLEPVVSANVVTYTTIITAPNEDLKLKPGMTANIFIYTREADSALLIPAKALKYRPDSTLTDRFKIIRRRQPDQAPSGGNIAFVWVKMGDSLIEKKITTGLNDDTQAQVLNGLSENEEVVTGTEIPSKGGASAKATTQKSPFMPARRPSGGGNRPAGAGGGR